MDMIPIFLYTALCAYLCFRKKRTEADHVLALVVALTYPITARFFT